MKIQWGGGVGSFKKIGPNIVVSSSVHLMNDPLITEVGEKALYRQDATLGELLSTESTLLSEGDTTDAHSSRR